MLQPDIFKNNTSIAVHYLGTAFTTDAQRLTIALWTYAALVINVSASFSGSVRIIYYELAVWL